MRPKQRVFIDEYLHCWNAAEAARRAGYSRKSARGIGAENLGKPEIAAEIIRRMNERTMSADEALYRLTEQARGEYGRYILADGTVDLAGMITDRKTHLIKRVRKTRYGVEVEFADAQAALALIGKHLKLFTDRVEAAAEVNVIWDLPLPEVQ